MTVNCYDAWRAILT